VVDIAKGLIQGQATEFHYYQRYHHYLLHGWPGALLVTAVLSIFARQRTRTALLCLLTYHLHLLCDLIGSRGPEAGDFWPIAYSEPFFRHPMWIWHGQWRLDGWQNQIIFAALFVFALWVSAKKGVSFLEFFGRRVESIFVSVMRRWFGAAGLLSVSHDK
jgi:inner membrane protein